MNVKVVSVTQVSGIRFLSNTAPDFWESISKYLSISGNHVSGPNTRISERKCLQSGVHPQYSPTHLLMILTP